MVLPLESPPEWMSGCLDIGLETVHSFPEALKRSCIIHQAATAERRENSRPSLLGAGASRGDSSGLGAKRHVGELRLQAIEIFEQAFEELMATLRRFRSGRVLELEGDSRRVTGRESEQRALDAMR